MMKEDRFGAIYPSNDKESAANQMAPGIKPSYRNEGTMAGFVRVSKLREIAHLCRLCAGL